MTLLERITIKKQEKLIRASGWTCKKCGSQNSSFAQACVCGKAK